MCAAASYEDLTTARVAKRKVTRALRRNIQATFCELCGKFHLNMTAEDSELLPKWLEILEYIAQGLRTHEIAPLVGMTYDSVNWTIRMMQRRFYALDRANLVAIAMSIGLIDPKKFVPGIADERTHG